MSLRVCVCVPGGDEDYSLCALTSSSLGTSAASLLNNGVYLKWVKVSSYYNLYLYKNSTKTVWCDSSQYESATTKYSSCCNASGTAYILRNPPKTCPLVATNAISAYSGDGGTVYTTQSGPGTIRSFTYSDNHTYSYNTAKTGAVNYSTYVVYTAVATEGWQFSKWKKASSGTTYSTDSTISIIPGDYNDENLIAEFIALTITVSFDSNGGSSVDSQSGSGSVTISSSPSSTKTGYTLSGWYNGSSQVSFPYTTSSNVTLTAHWTANNYTVTFDANGGTVTTTSKSVTYNSTYGTLPTPTAADTEHYTFGGWYTAATGGSLVTSSTTVKTASNHTLYAHWTPNKYTITLVAGTGGNVTGSGSYDYGSAHTITATPLEHYTFAKWADDATALASRSVIVYGDATYTASFTANTYTTSFDSHGGTEFSYQAVQYPNTIILPTPSRTGYSFSGWYTAASSGTKVGDGGDTYQPTSTTTLHAQWSDYKYYIDVSNGYGGTIGDPTQVEFSEVFTATAPTRDYYVFKGWQVTNNLNTTTGKYGTSSSSVTTSITSASQVCYNGVSGNVYFKGLNPSPTASNVHVTITALWERKSYSVTVDNSSLDWNARVVCNGGSFEHWNGSSKVTVNSNTDTTFDHESKTFTFYAGLAYSVSSTYYNATKTDAVFNVLKSWGGYAVTRNNTGTSAAIFTATHTMNYTWLVTPLGGGTPYTVYSKSIPNPGYSVNAYSNDACTTSPSDFSTIKCTAADTYEAWNGSTQYSGSIAKTSDDTQTWSSVSKSVTVSKSSPFSEIIPSVTLSFHDDDTSGTYVKAVAGTSDGVVFGEWTNVTGTELETASSAATAKFQVSSSNVSMTASYNKAEVTVTAILDPLSATACGQTLPTITISPAPPNKIYYKDAVTLSITGIPQPLTFAGWYVNGVLVSENAETPAITISGNTNFVAKLKATVTLSKQISEETEGTVSGSLILNGTVYNGTSCSQSLVIGDTISIGVTLNNSNSHFICWYNAADSEHIPLNYSQNQSGIVVTNVVGYVAYLMDASQEYYVAFYNRNANTSTIDNTLGQLTPSATSFASITKSEYETATSTTALGDGVFYRFNSTQTMQLSIVKTGSLEYLRCKRFKVGASSEGGAYSTEQTVISVINQNFVFVAEWGTPTRYTLKASLASSEDLSKGEVDVEGYVTEKSYNGTNTTGKSEAGMAVVVWAKAKNGYDFGGWYSTSDCTGTAVSTLAYYEFDMPSNDYTLYAKFVTASVSLYRWEGGSANKQLKWKSKCYALSRPANLNSVRVDATGYPLARCKIESYSSPDTAATSTVDLTGNAALANQTMRRLPTKRPERFFQVTVESTNEVDAIILGTSGEGLAT